MTDGGLEAWGFLLRVHATTLPRIEAELRATGLQLSWYDVLLVLGSAPERRLRMGDLAAGVVISRERVSRVVTEMERAGLVERQPNPHDGRSAFAAMTPAGRTALRKAAPVYLRAVEEHFSSHLSASEARSVARALAKVHSATS